MLFLLIICLLLSVVGYFGLLGRLWLVEGTMDTSALILLGGGALMLIAYGIKHASIPILWLSIILMGGGSIFYDVLNNYYERSSLRDQRLEDAAKFERRVEFNTADWMAYRDMAKIYMQLEMYDKAIEAYKNAIRQDPPEVNKLRRELNKALDSHRVGKMSESLLCPNCRLETPRSSKVCIHCGEPTHFNFESWLSSPDVSDGIIRYIVLGLAAATILTLVLAPLSLEEKAVLAISCVLVCGFLVWRSIDNAG